MIKSIRPTILYRGLGKTKYIGKGSFWSNDIKVAIRFGGPAVIAIKVEGKALFVKNDEELVKFLNQIGLSDAEDLVMDADWINETTFDAIKKLDWIVRPVDLNESQDKQEWIYVGEANLTRYRIGS